MRKLKGALLALTLIALLGVGEFRSARIATVEGGTKLTDPEGIHSVLSPIWGASIRQWSAHIYKESQTYGFDPDFIAAVIQAESNGYELGVSRVGAVGLMGVMPAGPGLEWRPAPDTLTDPEINMSWGVAILTEIIHQSGGDIVAALAAYSGGWDQANSRVPQEYASQVLDSYGRAVAARENISPDIATQWTVATEISRGHIPVDRLILNEEPLSGLRKYGEHVVYNHIDNSGRAYYVKGFAVPLAVIVPLESTPATSSSDTVDTQLMARLGMADTKINNSNPRVLLSCLPSLSRLRGSLATRYYAPSGCPSWHR
jgi:hypothetical protein